MDALLRAARGTARVAVWAGGGLLILSACLVTFDVIARKFFGYSLAGADEISGYVFAVSTAFAFSFCVLERANVRIDALYNLLPTRLLGWLDLLGLVLLAVFVGMVTWRGALFALDSYELGSRSITPLQTPLVVPQALWVLGLALFCLVLLLLIVATGLALARGDVARAQALAGVRTRDEEMAAELGEQKASG